MARPLIILCAGLLALPALAGDLRDPTRPPPGQAADAPAPAPLRLTSVMLRPGGRSLAMIDGAPVRVGDRLAEGKVTAIDEGGLWLRTDTGPRRIGLLPAVLKTPAGKMEKTRK
jgi:MSHA biogenesis protein MshK